MGIDVHEGGKHSHCVESQIHGGGLGTAEYTTL